MTILLLLADWALRSAVLILGGALLLWALRVKGASIRLAAWTAILCSSMAIPALPKISFAAMRAAAPAVIQEPMPTPAIPGDAAQVASIPRSFNWVGAVLIFYSVVAGVLLVRLGTGLFLSARLRRRSRSTGRVIERIEIWESDILDSPIALGVLRPAILLPNDWILWDEAKLDAVLAHERSHIRRYDPAVQFVSAIHRALLWFSPMSWFLHREIVRVAEEASDDAAVASTGDRALYAKVLLEFLGRGVRRANWIGVPMARYGRPDQRIHRILEGAGLPPRVTRWNVAAILALGLPLAYVVAVARPVSAQPGSPRAAAAPLAPASEAVAPPQPESSYLAGLGAVTAYTVTVKSRVDGQLMSVSFKEGDRVQAGQILATIDPRPYELQLAQAEGELAREQAEFAVVTRNRKDLPPDQVAQVDGSMKVTQAKVDEAKLHLTYTQIASPITGVAGLLLVDPGNVVHANDTTGIVIINQLQPIAVVFTIQEDRLQRVLARMRAGNILPVEAWSRDSKVRLAAGRLTAVDNQIDTTTGTVKLKAEFANKDGALYPNQFVNVHLLVN